ncbi:hypothetical protein [Ehrlichia muris]|uniref:Uncharacterized protein n=1 Tax=Ehrlichia cf. muris str. EmCRT TaxID=1359167 RepID=A0A0F3ND72_9RICK|nr:hypothetical protein [Ehrlichia muris]KJV65691.1 hypothetical protein EMUCRT_0644 [Ehrlichia cf. muris str. EmCRT]
MLTDQKFNHINQAFARYSEIFRHHKSVSKYNMLLASCTYLTILVSLVSIVVLYHYNEFFRPIFNGKYKLFGAEVPVIFSVALIIAIPSFLLLCFLIYKRCKDKHLTSQLMGEANNLMSSVAEVCQFLKDELNTSKHNINMMMNSYANLEGRYNILANQCSNGLDNLNAECSRLDVLLSKATVTMDGRFTVLQDVIEDIRQKVCEVSVCYSHVRDMENALQRCISNSLKAANVTLEQKVQLLRELHIDFATPVTSVDGLRCSMLVVMDSIKNDVPKSTGLSLFNKDPMRLCMWKLHDSLSSALSRMGTPLVDVNCIFELVEVINEFFSAFDGKVKNRSGPDLQKLLDIKLHAQLLQIRLLRFLLKQRSTMLVEACSSAKDFVGSSAAMSEEIYDPNVDDARVAEAVCSELDVSGDNQGVNNLSMGADSKGATGGNVHP